MQDVHQASRLSLWVLKQVQHDFAFLKEISLTSFSRFQTFRLFSLPLPLQKQAPAVCGF
jgi:hypothetical protein